VTLPTSDWIVCARNQAHDRFEGEYPGLTWPHGRDAQALVTGYAPSKYRTKPWPTKALLEVWYSPLREVPLGYMLAVPSFAAQNVPQTTVYKPVARDRPRSALAVNANHPPGVQNDDVGGEDGVCP